MLTIDNIGKIGGSGKYNSQILEYSDNNVIVRFVNNILSDMDPLLTSSQLLELDNVLQKTILNYSIGSDERLYEDIDYKELNKTLLTQFLEDKKLQGLSPKTLEVYDTCLNYVFEYIGKGVDSITADDIRDYLEYCIEERKASMVTVDNYRRYLNTFYTHCVNNGLLYKNPCLKIDAIKKVKKVKQAFSHEEIIYLREHLNNLRDKAIFELLLSSGMRVGELVKLNRNDLNLNDCSVVVHGKGDKERETFFNELAKVSLIRYFESRDDYDPAAFVSLNKPHNRLKIGGVEGMLSNLGKRAGVSKVHPHRFRRHFATSLLHKGVHIEQIQQLLGHAEIHTTQMYVVLDDDELKYNHKRYVN